MKHIKLAETVIEMLLSGEEEVLYILRKQYESARVISEKESETGFYIDYQVDEKLKLTDNFNCTFQIGDVDGTVDGIDEAVGFLLYIKNGYLIMLEGYTNIIDKWPERDSQIKLEYDAKIRDYSILRKKWVNLRTKEE